MYYGITIFDHFYDVAVNIDLIYVEKTLLSQKTTTAPTKT